MKRYQFIWWGWRDFAWHPARHYPGRYDGRGAFYLWWLYLGPLEIRKWKARP